jgi:hypothetical protein
LGWDSGVDLQVPDRAEFFWPKVRNFLGANIGGKGPAFPANAVDYNDIRMVAEAASSRFSIAVGTLYRSLDYEFFRPNGAAEVVDHTHAANFGDLDITAKTLLLDCDLMQFAFQFKTYIPTGNFQHGLGNAHVSLEPALLMTLCLMRDTYLQMEVAEWIPLGGDQNYEGCILHYHTAVNRTLWRPIHDVQLVGSVEFNGWSFQTGEFTDPVFGPFQKAGNHSFFNAGPGLRLVICDKIDFGFAAAFAVTEDKWPEELYRFEFRWRF